MSPIFSGRPTGRGNGTFSSSRWASAVLAGMGSAGNQEDHPLIPRAVIVGRPHRRYNPRSGCPGKRIPRGRRKTRRKRSRRGPRFPRFRRMYRRWEVRAAAGVAGRAGRGGRTAGRVGVAVVGIIVPAVSGPRSTGRSWKGQKSTGAEEDSDELDEEDELELEEEPELPEPPVLPVLRRNCPKTSSRSRRSMSTSMSTGGRCWKSRAAGRTGRCRGFEGVAPVGRPQTVHPTGRWIPPKTTRWPVRGISGGCGRFAAAGPHRRDTAGAFDVPEGHRHHPAAQEEGDKDADYLDPIVAEKEFHLPYPPFICQIPAPLSGRHQNGSVLLI